MASNHASVLDPVLIGSAIPDRRISFLAKRELFTPPFWSRLLPRLNAFPVDRSSLSPGTVRTMKRILAGGGSLLVFPEGTRTRTGELLPGRRGAGFLALSLEVPVVPLRVRGSFPILPPGRLIPRLARGLRVVFGPEVPLSDLLGAADPRAAQQAASDRIMAAISAL